MADPLRHHEHYQDDGTGGSFMERVAEAVASGMGTVGFVVISTLIIVVWIASNAVAARGSWDPYPFILLNLMFSAVAFYTGALVIIAQKAQTRSDRLNEEAAAKHREELDGVQRDLLQRNTELTERIEALTAEIHEHIVAESSS